MKNLISIIIYMLLINFPGCKIFNNYTQQNERNIQINNKNARDKALSDMRPLESAIDVFLLNTTQYPQTLEELIMDPGLTGWAGPYIKKERLNDPWGNPYIYNLFNNGYELISYGADGIEGGEGFNEDIYND